MKRTRLLTRLVCVPRQVIAWYYINPKKAAPAPDHPPPSLVFRKVYFIKRGCTLVSHIFPENFIEITKLLKSFRRYEEFQGSTVTIKSPYVKTYVCQNFGVRDVDGQKLKRMYLASYLLPSDFFNNFS